MTTHRTLCASCGSPLSGRRQQKFCSWNCSLASIVKPAAQWRTTKCLTCEGLLKNKHQRKFCSSSCAAKHNNKNIDRHQTARGRPLSHPCANCGAQTKNQTYCCRQCKVDKIRKWNTQEERRAIKNEAWHRYMAKKKKQTPPDVDIEALRQIYINCPLGHEVDHRIPISKGGLHHPDNLQYLPISENRRKSDKIGTSAGD